MILYSERSEEASSLQCLFFAFWKQLFEPKTQSLCVYPFFGRIFRIFYYQDDNIKEVIQ